MDSKNNGEQWRTLGRTLHKTHDQISRLRDVKLRKKNLTPIRVGVLSLLVEASKPVTISIIASKMARESHTVTELLMRMQKDGLVEKVRQKDTPALYHIETTEKGKKAYQDALKIDIERDLFSILSPQEQDTLIVYLEKLRGRVLDELRKHINIPSE